MTSEQPRTDDFDGDDEQTYTEDQYIDYGRRQYRRGRKQAEYEARSPDAIDYLEREGVLSFADEGHRQRVIDGLPASPSVALDEGLLAEARKAIEGEILMASDPEGKDQFEKGALAAYHFALSVLSAPPGDTTDAEG